MALPRSLRQIGEGKGSKKNKFAAIHSRQDYWMTQVQTIKISVWSNFEERHSFMLMHSLIFLSAPLPLNHILASGHS